MGCLFVCLGFALSGWLVNLDYVVALRGGFVDDLGLFVVWLL